DRLYVDDAQIEVKIFNRAELFRHAAEPGALEPKQRRLGDCHGPNEPALPFGFDRVGPVEHRMIRDVVFGPLAPPRWIARLDHLVYVPLNHAHELTHLSVAQLLPLALLILLSLAR